jgi:hypothetical protein
MHGDDVSYFGCIEGPPGLPRVAIDCSVTLPGDILETKSIPISKVRYTPASSRRAYCDVLSQTIRETT